MIEWIKGYFGWQIDKALLYDEVKDLRDKIKKYEEKRKLIDLWEMTMWIDNPETSHKDTVDIQFLTKQDQWGAVRAYMLKNAMTLSHRAASAGKEDSYCLSRISAFLVELVKEIELVEPESLNGLPPDDPYDG